MGRPVELTDEERQKLIADGYRPVEVWIKDTSTDEFWQQIEDDCRHIRESDRRSHMDKVLDAFVADNWDNLG